jgi:integrase
MIQCDNRPSEVGIRRHGARWQIFYYDQHGRQRFETVRGSLTTAWKVRAERIHQVQTRKFGILEHRQAPTLERFVQPISWHDLRHLFVSLLIAAGKHPKYIASAARHRDPGFSLRVYGHLFDSMPVTPVEWWDDLLWPAGCPYLPAFDHPSTKSPSELAHLTQS